jgi:probable HAF family extracellular repeat protein
MTDIGPFGDSESYANDVNNRGQVVGTFLTEDRSAFHAFLYSDGVFTDLGSAISPDTSAQAINDSGQIVGIWFLPYEDLCYDFELNDYVPCIKYEQQAFIYRNRRMKNLNDLIPPFSGWDLIAAFDINDRGQIVGYGLRGDKIHAFLMTLRGHACEHSERCLSPACTPPRKAAQRQHLRGEMPAPLIVEPASGAKRRASWHMRGEALPERRR